MIRSMTAYTHHEINADWGKASWEIRSVNHRYLETSFRLPEPFRHLEATLREQLRARLTRGKIECALRLELSPTTQSTLQLDETLAQQLLTAAKWVQQQGGKGVINPLEILRWPGVIGKEEHDLDAMRQQLLDELQHALDHFIANREREGEALRKLLEQRLQGVRQQVALVRQHMPNILQWQREKLHSKVEEAQLQVDAHRLEQEIVLLAQRIDVAEELDRLDTHCQEIHTILHKGQAAGRRLDFMMQELNREANTLASKSINTEVTNCAVELKVLIEQMREQIQNIE